MTDETEDATSSASGRRRALRFGAVALGGAIVVACSDDQATNPVQAPQPTPPAPSSVPTASAAAPPSPDSSESSIQSDQPAAGAIDCVLTPEDTEGPFFADLDLDRRDITDGRPGSPLEISLTVVDGATCEPIPNAMVDIWHADAGGQYSAFPGQGDAGDIDTSGRSFLRGAQTTDDQGSVTFTTIYPGWYSGRTTHVHLKVRLDDRTMVTTQLYFPDEVTAAVYTGPDYLARGAKDTPNDADRFGAGSANLRLSLNETQAGHLATHTIGVAPR